MSTRAGGFRGPRPGLREGFADAYRFAGNRIAAALPLDRTLWLEPNETRGEVSARWGTRIRLVDPRRPLAPVSRNHSSRYPGYMALAFTVALVLASSIATRRLAVYTIAAVSIELLWTAGSLASYLWMVGSETPYDWLPWPSIAHALLQGAAFSPWFLAPVAIWLGVMSCEAWQTRGAAPALAD